MSIDVKSQKDNECDLMEISAYIHGVKKSYSIKCDTLEYIEMLLKSYEKSYQNCNFFNRNIKNKDSLKENSPLSAGVTIRYSHRTNFVILYLIEYEILNNSHLFTSCIPYIRNNKTGYKIEAKFYELEYLDAINPVTNEKYKLVYKKDNKELKKIFKLYKKWVKKAKKIGLSEIRKNQINPFNGSKYEWVVP